MNIKETLEETYMIITNDGRKPNEFITENQGIKDMRRKVKKLGGMFYISTVPEFSVNISIKITANIEIAVILYSFGVSRFGTIKPLPTQYIASFAKLL